MQANLAAAQHEDEFVSIAQACCFFVKLVGQPLLCDLIQKPFVLAKHYFDVFDCLFCLRKFRRKKKKKRKVEAISCVTD